MSDSDPGFEPRRQKELLQELLARAQLWLPDWRPKQGNTDFGLALLRLAARLESEVTQRLDRMPEKNFRGFLHWIGMRGAAARPARIPVAFKMTQGADPVLAPRATRLQAQAGEESVTFETTEEVQVLPGALTRLIGVDPAQDAYYIAPDDVFALALPEPLPTEWRVKSFAAAGSRRLQLGPELGLKQTLVLDVLGQEYRITQIDSDIVTVEPALGTIEMSQDGTAAPGIDGVPADTVVRAVTQFAPFDGTARNRQQHHLYVGDAELLNVEAPVTIELSNAQAISTDAQWTYWGKLPDQEEPSWLPLEVKRDGDVLRLLKKSKGPLEPVKINDVQSRWLRAQVDPGPAQGVELAGIEMRLRAGAGNPVATALCPNPAKRPEDKVTVEGFANTTPLVLDSEFYPFGREPRRFDAFYLGSPEAFSKANAEVTICLEMANPTLRFAAIGQNPKTPGWLLFGVGTDGYLHRVEIDPAGAVIAKFLTPVQPHQSDASAGSPRNSGAAIALDQTAKYRPAVLTWAFGFTFVAVPSSSDIWLWTEAFADFFNGWRPLNFASKPRGVVLLLEAFVPRVVAIDESGKLRTRAGLGSETWQDGPLGLPAGVVCQRITPVIDAAAPRAAATIAHGFVVVSEQGTLHLRRGGAWTESDSVADGFVEPDVVPVAIATAANTVLVVTQRRGQDRLTAWEFVGAADGVVVAEIDAELVADVGFDVVPRNPNPPLILLRVASGGEAPRLAFWSPLDAALDQVLFIQDAPDGYSGLQGPPVYVPDYRNPSTANCVVVPGEDADVFGARFDAASGEDIDVPAANAFDGIFMREPPTIVMVGDFIEARYDSAQRETRAVTQTFLFGGGAELLAIDPNDPLAQPDAIQTLRLFPAVQPVRQGPQSAARKLELSGADNATVADSVLLIQRPNVAPPEFRSYRVANVTEVAGVRTATFQMDLPGNVGDILSYRSYLNPLILEATIRPALRLTAATPPDLVLLIQRVRAATWYSKSAAADPPRQRVLFADESTGFVILASAWAQEPLPVGGNFQFRLSSEVGPWQRARAQTNTNPELSWEYWDGTAWWKIDGIVDETGRLLKTGHIILKVPGNLKPTDVAGKTSHWIRARLTGGDYGQETVRVETSTGNPSTQTIIRDSSTVHPPRVLSIDVTYESLESAKPTWLLTLDSGAFRDQGDANRTAGAMVEAFVPLAVVLGRLQKPSATSRVGQDEACECDPCRCEDGGDEATQPVGDAGGRALYLALEEAFARPLTTGAVRILMLVEERAHDDAFPLQVEILRGGRFEPAGQTNDATRGLSESGLVSFTLARPPTLTSLFGKDAYWIRIRPNARTIAANWKPVLRGAYLNAAYALATDTQEIEIVGSSDGSPDQHLRLARSPIVPDSLELRIREPLGEEEQAELRRSDLHRVEERISELRGPWVRWQEVPDPHDRGPVERVFSLDHDTGEIAFGDGTRGRLPPAGRDNILAVRYQRAGTSIANQVLAWSSLNLVTPLSGVEEVIAPEAAAGGSDAEDVPTTLRFGPARLRHRDRALTPRDLEQLALQFSPLLSQASAFSSPDGVRLIVVGRARDLIPSRALRRELQRFLLERAPPDLTRARALEIVPPELVMIRVVLKLAASNIDEVGDLGRAVKARVERYFNPASGGMDGLGWRLGERPADFELAAQLDSLQGLAGITSIDFVDSAADATEAPLAEDIAPTQLVCLAADGIELAFEASTAEVET